MKILFTCILTCCLLSAFAQIVPLTGTYTTSDGNYNVNILYSNNTLTIVEPNKTSPYKYAKNNIYTFTNPVNNIDYAVEVIDQKTLGCYHPSTPDNVTKLIFNTGTNSMAPKEVIAKYKQIADNYTAKLKTDPSNTQAWAFCAAAALAHAYYNEEGFKIYAAKVARSLKLIIVDKSKCPCEDALPKDIWDSVQ
ncbi:hypothetical protein KXQ82_00115 [Mucilaginibacter sp. HMF5004]|uniref:hypothetical protein n=1 Tax=Mucilaginibacter rivuli TaxID=2857527 RepID=UPI001C5F5907|nr:hypothetical protein [Mucilaginibacter rivuli]MBW4888089.1 hypothetical protein [Mucilaginibacter rivuli]